jgi:hypothetical protein
VVAANTGVSAGCGTVSGSAVAVAVAVRVISRDTNALKARRLGTSPWPLH